MKIVKNYRNKKLFRLILVHLNYSYYSLMLIGDLNLINLLIVMFKENIVQMSKNCVNLNYRIRYVSSSNEQ